MPTATTTNATDDARRWAARPVRARLIRAAIFLAPILVSIAFVYVASRLVPPPNGDLLDLVLWWLAITALATGVLAATDRLTRRLLPIVALYKLSLIFPDRVPSRFEVALRTGTAADLETELAAVRAADTPQGAAERLLALVAHLDAHDALTSGHSDRVRAYSRMIAEEMGLPSEDVDKLNWAALLHDVGKLEVPAEVLQKQDELNEAEFALLREHPERGMAIAGPLVAWLGEWADAIGDHHEWWDGGGYPRGLTGEDISPAGRIVAVADVFDVITSTRAYKEANDPAAGREEIARCAGSQFDPKVVRAFLGVSLGSLRLAMGPLSWLAQIPVLGPAPATPVVTTVANAAVAVATTTTLGLVPHPDVAIEPPIEIIPAAAAQVSQPEVVTPAAPEPASPRAGGLSRSVLEDNVLVVPRDEFSRLPGTESVALAAAPGAGSARVDDASTLIYRPPRDFNGRTSLAYKVCWRGDGCATEVLRITVLPANDAPVAADDTATVLKGATAFLDVLANDADLDGDDLVVAAVGQPSAGTATSNGGGILWTPPKGFTGEATVGYTAADGGGLDAAAKVRLTVTDVNAPPVFTAGPDQTVAEDAGPQAVSGWAGDIAPGAVGESDQTVRFALTADNPALFSARPAVAPNGTLTYTPAPDANGQTTVTVEAVDDGGTDGGGDDRSAPQTFTITVAPVNDPPTFRPGDDQTVGEDSGARSVAGWATEMSPGPQNEADQAVEFVTSNDTPALFAVAPAIDPTGRLSFTPATDANGEALVTVVARDTGGARSAGRAFTIAVTAENDAPDARDDEVTVDEDEAGGVTFNVLANDRDAESGSLSVAAIDTSGIVEGTLTANGGGSYTYEPAPDDNGSESFAYTVRDGDGGSDTATVTITIVAQPDDPVAAAESYLLTRDEVLSVAAPGLLANDSDVDGNVLSVQTTPASGPANGSVTLGADGAFTYTPDRFYTGPDTFTYRVTDGTGRADEAVVSLTIAPPAPGITTLYLQPTGASADDWDLLTTRAPNVIPVPDHDGDGQPGLAITASDGAEGNTDPLEFQLWSYDVPAPIRLDGPVRLRLWSTVADFEEDEASHPYLYLYDCDALGANCSLIAQNDLYVAGWNGGVEGWVFRIVPIGNVTRNIDAGRTLRVRLLNAQEDLWVALTQTRGTALVITTG